MGRGCMLRRIVLCEQRGFGVSWLGCVWLPFAQLLACRAREKTRAGLLDFPSAFRAGENGLAVSKLGPSPKCRRALDQRDVTKVASVRLPCN